MPSLQAEAEHGDNDEIEATEMFGRQEPSPTGAACSTKPTSTWGKVCYSLEQRLPPPVKKFWNNQVSATVAHDRCRDHWGRQKQSQQKLLLCL